MYVNHLCVGGGQHALAVLRKAAYAGHERLARVALVNQVNAELGQPCFALVKLNLFLARHRYQSAVFVPRYFTFKTFGNLASFKLGKIILFFVEILFTRIEIKVIFFC